MSTVTLTFDQSVYAANPEAVLHTIEETLAFLCQKPLPRMANFTVEIGPPDDDEELEYVAAELEPAMLQNDQMERIFERWSAKTDERTYRLLRSTISALKLLNGVYVEPPARGDRPYLRTIIEVNPGNITTGYFNSKNYLFTEEAEKFMLEYAEQVGFEMHYQTASGWRVPINADSMSFLLAFHQHFPRK
jgi:hypothetical protein